jgi:hypothetical protein
VFPGRRIKIEPRLAFEKFHKTRLSCYFLFKKSKEQQRKIAEEITALLKNKNENKRWVAAVLLESMLLYDPSLVTDAAILLMSRDKSFSVRSSAAVCLFTLAQLAPSRVPLDVVIKRASSNEDWYVFIPALATLKTLAHKAPRAFDVIWKMAISDDQYEAEQGIDALIEVASNDPEIIDETELALLHKSSSTYVRKNLKRLKSILKRGEQGSNIIRYSPF